MFIFLQLFLYFSSVQSSLTPIQTLSLKNFSLYNSVQVGIDQSLIGQQLIMEVTLSYSVPNSISQCQFLFMAAQPNVTLPEYYSVLFQSDVSQFQSQNIYIDVEGYGTMRKFQFVNILSLTSSQIGTWNLGFYDLKSDKVTLYNINIVVYAQSNSDIYCPYNCNASSTPSMPAVNTNFCTQVQTPYQNYCTCGVGYLGEECYFNSPLTTVGESINIQVPAQQWTMLSFNISSYSNSQFSAQIQGTYSKLKMSFVYGSVSTLWVPNIIYDCYDITSSTTGSTSTGYPLLQEKVSLMFSSSSLSAIAAKYPYRRASYDQVLTVGFFNYNPQSDSNFVFQFQQVNSGGSDSSGINQTTMVLFIIFGCVIIFCVTPITYFCVKQKKRQEKDLLNQILGNNQIQGGGENGEQQSERDQNNGQRQQRDQANPNQNGILEQLNQPVSQLVVSGTVIISRPLSPQIMQLQAPVAQIENMEVDRLKPIKKIVPITKETINRFMPKQKYCDIIRLYPSLKDEGDECTVCLESFEQENECRITPCYHLFHSDCLESWFQKHSTCPYCRSPCNRKGIIKQLQSGQLNSYVKRMQRPLAKDKHQNKQIKSEGDLEVEEQDTNRVLEEMQIPQSLSPGRRYNESINHDKDEGGVGGVAQALQNNFQLSDQKDNPPHVYSLGNQELNRNPSNSNPIRPMQKKPSLVESVLHAINKPFMQLRKESSSVNQNNQNNINNQQLKSNPQMSPEKPKEGKKENIDLNLEKQEKDVPQFLISNNSLNRNANNNNPILSINCLSQNAFIDQGNELFSFMSPNISQIQHMPANDVMFSLNNSLQKRMSFVNDQDRQNGVLSPENSFQMVSTTRKMFAEQEYMNKLSSLHQQRMQQLEKDMQNYDDYDKPIECRRSSNNNISQNFNLEKGDDGQIYFNRYRTNSSMEQGRKIFINEADLIDNYGNGNIGNEDEDNANEVVAYQKNRQQAYLLSGNNSVIKKPMQNISKRSKHDLSDPANLPQSEMDLSTKANQIPLPSRNILNSQPRFFQESNRHESFRLNNQTQLSDKSKHIQSLQAENIQNTSANRTIDDQRYGNKDFQIKSNHFQENIDSTQYRDNRPSIQNNNYINENRSNNNSINLNRRISNQAPKAISEQQFQHVQVVNKLIVLDDDDTENNGEDQLPMKGPSSVIGVVHQQPKKSRNLSNADEYIIKFDEDIN